MNCIVHNREETDTHTEKVTLSDSAICLQHLPEIWRISDYIEHIVIENYFGETARLRSNSFTNVMLSPLPRAHIQTALGQFCSNYDYSPKSHGSFENFNTIFKERKKFEYYFPSTFDFDSLDTQRSHETSRFIMPLLQYRLSAIQKLESEAPGSSPEGSTISGLSLESLNSPLNPMRSTRLYHKLQDSLIYITRRVEEEKIAAIQAARKCQLLALKSRQHTGVVWDLLCGSRTSLSMRSDGLDQLYAALSSATHNRSLNQLQRHKRHLSGIFQIMTSHNPDLTLTERQLDSFESVDSMLEHDLKYHILKKQLFWLEKALHQRQKAGREAKLRYGSDCFEKLQVKREMMHKLLVAVSYYRLAGDNCRDLRENESRANGTSDGALSIEKITQTLSQIGNFLQELEEKDVYSDLFQNMSGRDWRDHAQAHFENLIFSRVESRICQIFFRLSMDVASRSIEDLEKNLILPNSPEKRHEKGLAAHETLHFKAAQRTRNARCTREFTVEYIVQLTHRVTRHIRREFDISEDVTKSLDTFIQRSLFPRLALLCFTQKNIRDCQRKDQLWRKICNDLCDVPMEALKIPSDLAAQIRVQLPSRRLETRNGRQEDQIYLIRAIDAFRAMTSIVPCELLGELMQGIVVLHHEAALILGTTKFPVEVFFPLLSYVLLHAAHPCIHAQLHILENFAIDQSNVSGEESYYVYCVHGAIEYICNSAHAISIAAQSLSPNRARDKKENDAISDSKVYE